MADLFNCCRICLQIKLTNASLYRYVDLKYLPNVIKNICGVVISSTEEPCARICKECTEAITKADAIIQKCQKSHKIFMRQRQLYDNNVKLKLSAAGCQKGIEFNAQDETQSFFQIYCAEPEMLVESVPENALHEETRQEQEICRNDVVLLNESEEKTARKFSALECEKQMEFTAQDETQSFFQIYCAESKMLVESIPGNSLQEETCQEQNICSNDAVIRNESNGKKARKVSAKHGKKEIELNAQDETLSFVKIYCAEPETIPENSLHEENSQEQEIGSNDVVLLNESKRKAARQFSAIECKKELDLNAEDENLSFVQIYCAEPEMLEPMTENSLHEETSQVQKICSNDAVLLNESEEKKARKLSATESKKEMEFNAQDETQSFFQIYCAEPEMLVESIPENSMHEETSQEQEIGSNDVVLLNESNRKTARKLSAIECKKNLDLNAEDENLSFVQIYCSEREMLVEPIPENSLHKETRQDHEIGSNDVVLLNESKRKTSRKLPAAIECKKNLDLNAKDETQSFFQIYCAESEMLVESIPENSLQEETSQEQNICSNDAVIRNESNKRKKPQKISAKHGKKEIELNAQDETLSFVQIYCAEPEMLEPMTENSLHEENSQEQEIVSNDAVLLNEIVEKRARKLSATESKKEMGFNAQDETQSFFQIYCAEPEMLVESIPENSVHEETSQEKEISINDVVLLNEGKRKTARKLSAEDGTQSFFEIYCAEPEMLVETIPENSLHKETRQDHEIGSSDVDILNESKRKTARKLSSIECKKELYLNAEDETLSFVQIYCAKPENSLHEETSHVQKICSNDVVLLNESNAKTARKLSATECKKEIEFNAQDETESFFEIYCAQSEMLVESISGNSLHEENSREQNICSNEVVLPNESKRKIARKLSAIECKQELDLNAEDETQSFVQIYCYKPEMLTESIPENSRHEETTQEQKIGSNDVVLLNESNGKNARKLSAIECKKEHDLNAEDETLSFIQIYCAKPEMLVETSHEQSIGSNDVVRPNDSKGKTAQRRRPPLKFKDQKQHRGSSNSEKHPAASLYHSRNKTVKPKTKFMRSREQYLKRKICNYAVKEPPKLIGEVGVMLKRKPNSRVRVIPNFYYRCELCHEFESNVPSYAVSHLKSFHGIDRPAIFRCSQCDIKPFIKNQSLQEHIATIHEKKPKQRNYVCQECGNTYIYNCDLRKHLLRVHKMVEGISQGTVTR